MSAAKKIKMLLVEREMILTALSERLNKSLSTMSDKMRRDNFSEKDLKKIVEVLNYNYDIVFTDKDTGKQIKAGLCLNMIRHNPCNIIKK